MDFFDKWLLDDAKFEKRLKQEQSKAIIRERKEILRKEKAKNKKVHKKPTTSKLLLAAAFIVSFEILIFCEIAYFFNPDSGILVTLIGVPVSFVPIGLGYLKKSTAENTADGIVYEMAMAEQRQASGYGD